ncbi:MAG: ribosomal L7Ae/L30e/S12e/Gadd45 family protein [Firmicutes bacterium]|nr:ribosomal L7Ae/L30e/S12e/Gadd45 family protein [Bacillota bacterium]
MLAWVWPRESCRANTWGCPTVEEHRQSKKVVGIKQVKKALREGRALEVILADDADPALIEPLEEACREVGVPAKHTASMKELGRACSIAVGAACAAYVR